MRIAHVLTYVSADGAFGGPLAVMSEQTAELARRGHHVEVFAGWDGHASFAPLGVDVHLFPVRARVPGAGFSGLTAPGLVRALRARLHEFDVVHVHLARDLITMPAARAASRSAVTRLFVQTHGMVKPDSRLRARVFDLWMRGILRRAAGAFALTAVDADRLRAVETKAVVLDLPNGVTLPAEPERGAHADPEVLFLARLQPRKRVLLFADAARRLIADGVPARFTVVGPDEGDLAPLTTAVGAWGIADRLRYEGAVPPGQGRDRMARADVYVLPSLNEPFPMSVLEAMSVATPTVISETCHIAGRLGDAVIAFRDGPDEATHLTEAIRGLVIDTRARRALGERGRRAVADGFSIDRVVSMLEGYYSAEPVIGERRSSSDPRTEKST